MEELFKWLPYVLHGIVEALYIRPVLYLNIVVNRMDVRGHTPADIFQLRLWITRYAWARSQSSSHLTPFNQAATSHTPSIQEILSIRMQAYQVP